MDRELELKVHLEREDALALMGDIPPGELLVGPPAKHELLTIYFDTPAHDLRDAGISLRLRKQDNGWLQTIKSGTELAGGLSNPIQVETEVETARPRVKLVTDVKLRRRLERAINGARLIPVFETRVQRTTRVVQANGSVIELAVDDGEVKAGSSVERLSEAEFELKSGRVEDLLLAAEILLAGHRFEVSTRTKADRGYQLALGKSNSTAEPQKAEVVKLFRCQDSAQAFMAILASATQQIVINRSAVLETDDPKAAHQLRIGLRRLRSALFALKSAMKSETLRSFDGAARDLGRCVGTLRDADVLSTDIISPLETKQPAGLQYAELREALAQERDRRRDAVRAELDGPMWRKLQVHLSLWPTILRDSEHLQQPVDRLADKALAKSWRKSKRLGDEIGALRGERRHELRKALKKLRYQAEFFSSLYEEADTGAFIKALKSLQNVFGYVNDARMSEQLIDLAAEKSLSLRAASAAGFVVGHHMADSGHVWAGAQAAWQDLRNTKPIWA